MFVDIGDSLWRVHTLRLPPGGAFETQCLASNIGAALPGGLGFALGAGAEGGSGNRAVVFIVSGGVGGTGAGREREARCFAGVSKPGGLEGRGGGRPGPGAPPSRALLEAAKTRRDSPKRGAGQTAVKRARPSPTAKPPTPRATAGFR